MTYQIERRVTGGFVIFARPSKDAKRSFVGTFKSRRGAVKTARFLAGWSGTVEVLS